MEEDKLNKKGKGNSLWKKLEVDEMNEKRKGNREDKKTER